ncbi:MAG: hypothetical protein AB1894_15745 [Chloroflexota bacterium]
MNRLRPPDVILFKNAIPICYWYSAGGPDYPDYRRCADSPTEADEGRGKSINLKHTQPYSPELWAACQEYLQFRDASLKVLSVMFEQLSKGHIPPLLDTTKGD